MPDWLRLLGRWRTIRARDLDYGAAGEEGFIGVYRGRWRRPIEVVASRDELLTLADMIRDGEEPSDG